MRFVVKNESEIEEIKKTKIIFLGIKFEFNLCRKGFALNQRSFVGAKSFDRYPVRAYLSTDVRVHVRYVKQCDCNLTNVTVTQLLLI